MSLTMKAHGGFDAPWFVVSDDLASLVAVQDLSSQSLAEAQKAYIVEAFGLETDVVEGLTLVETFVLAVPLFAAAVAVAQGTGAKPAVSTKAPAKKAAAKPTAAAKATPAPAENVQVEQAPEAPAAEPEAPAEEHPHQGVLDEIAGATVKKDIMSIFNANKVAWQDKSVVEAAQAKLASF